MAGKFTILGDFKKHHNIFFSCPFVKDYLNGKISVERFLDNILRLQDDLRGENLTYEEIDSFRAEALGKRKHLSLEEWKAFWRAEGFKSGNNASAWYREKTILFFRMPQVKEEVTLAAIQGFNMLIKEIGLDLQIIDGGTDAWLVSAVKKFTEGEVLDVLGFHNHLTENSKTSTLLSNKPHGTVVAANLYSKRDRGWWGEGQFANGVSTILVKDSRQDNLPFIMNVAKHECTHLLGIEHHDENAMLCNAYSEVNDCLAFHRSSTLALCDKCRDAILNFWQGIEEKTGIKYFKKMFILSPKKMFEVH
ncbi:hypothetical protein HYU14_04030 [Candidatus Woesearchaeota archaeon]|nr:hypothetical protein [Candidatus Woesearchaeota archaeon]